MVRDVFSNGFHHRFANAFDLAEATVFQSDLKCRQAVDPVFLVENAGGFRTETRDVSQLENGSWRGSEKLIALIHFRTRACFKKLCHDHRDDAANSGKRFQLPVGLKLAD